MTSRDFKDGAALLSWLAYLKTSGYVMKPTGRPTKPGDMALRHDGKETYSVVWEPIPGAKNNIPNEVHPKTIITRGAGAAANC